MTAQVQVCTVDESAHELQVAPLHEMVPLVAVDVAVSVTEAPDS